MPAVLLLMLPALAAPFSCCRLPPLDLQTTTGKAAADITMEEANDIVEQLLKKVLESQPTSSRGRKRKPSKPYWLCCDNATVHNNVMEVLNKPEYSQYFQLWPQPSNSPECNKAVEHTHSQVQHAVHKWYGQLRSAEPQRRVTVQEGIAKARDTFFSISRESIKADILSLPATWKAIIAAEGDHIPHKLS
jgi:hypothetical protein